MLTQNSAAYSIKILAEIIGDILYFPIWWYSRGLVDAVMGLANFLSNKQKAWALLVWIKNIFKPMYAQRDWQGVLISIFMRLVQIFFRAIIMLGWSLFAMIGLLFWIALPPLVFFEIIYQLNLFNLFA
jgi:hypothetical protein